MLPEWEAYFWLNSFKKYFHSIYNVILDDNFKLCGLFLK